MVHDTSKRFVPNCCGRRISDDRRDRTASELIREAMEDYRERYRGTSISCAASHLEGKSRAITFFQPAAARRLATATVAPHSPHDSGGVERQVGAGRDRDCMAMIASV